MSLLKKWFLVPVVAFGFVFAADASDANAQFGIYTGRGISIHFGHGYRSYRPIYYGGGYRVRYGHGIPHRTYHSHGHYHYHPTEVIPHGNHFDVIPGHYDYYPGRHHGHWPHRRYRHH